MQRSLFSQITSYGLIPWFFHSIFLFKFLVSQQKIVLFFSLARPDISLKLRHWGGAKNNSTWLLSLPHATDCVTMDTQN